MAEQEKGKAEREDSKMSFDRIPGITGKYKAQKFRRSGSPIWMPLAFLYEGGRPTESEVYSCSNQK
jgi:hypothetical protein